MNIHPKSIDFSSKTHTFSMLCLHYGVFTSNSILLLLYIGVPLEHLTDRDKAAVPLIVTRICEYLRSQGFRQEGLFRVNGNMKVVDRLKNAFDKCKFLFSFTVFVYLLFLFALTACVRAKTFRAKYMQLRKPAFPYDILFRFSFFSLVS